MLHSVDNKICKTLKELPDAQKAAFFSAVIWGLITHLAVFSAGLMYHDGVNYSGLNATYSSGRWMLGIIDDIGSRFLGIYQLPYLNGFATIFVLAVCAAMITCLLKVRTKLAAVLIGAILVSFPSVASLFAFMFTAPVYSVALLMCVLSVYLVNEKPSLPRILIASVLLCLSLGIYRAYIAFAAPLAMLVVLCDGLRQEKADVKALLKKGLVFIITLAVGLVLYLLINKLIVAIKDISLTSYQNINQMGQFSLANLWTAVYFAYYYQITCLWHGMVTSGLMIRLTQAVEVLAIILYICSVNRKKENTVGCIFLTVLFLLLPAAFQSIFLVCAKQLTGIHSLMRYGLVFTYIFPIVLIEIASEKKPERKSRNLLCTVSLFVLLLVPLGFSYKDNSAYLNAATSQKQAVLYYNSLVTRIRDTEGYSDDLPIAYIGRGIQDSTLGHLPTYDKIQTFILSLPSTEIINMGSWRSFCTLHLGWEPEEVSDIKSFEELPEVKAMPCYPDSGSIKVINGAVVVKFSEPEEE